MLADGEDLRAFLKNVNLIWKKKKSGIILNIKRDETSNFMVY